MTEAAFQRQVLMLARLLGWRTAHFMPGLNRKGKWRTAVQGDGRGWPDLVLVRDRVVFAELKAERGRLKPEQLEWLEALAAAGQEVYVWRPTDWMTIEAVLKRGR